MIRLRLRSAAEVPGKVLGLDISMNSTGFSYLSEAGYVTGTICPGKARGMERIDGNACALRQILEKISPKLVMVEGYSYASKGKAYQTGENTGALKLECYLYGVPAVIVPPTVAKQYATGNGRADKDVMIAAVKTRWGITVEGSDEADAFVLYKMGVEYLRGRRLNGLKQSHMPWKDAVLLTPRIPGLQSISKIVETVHTS